MLMGGTAPTVDPARARPRSCVHLLPDTRMARHIPRSAGLKGNGALVHRMRAPLSRIPMVSCRGSSCYCARVLVILRRAHSMSMFGRLGLLTFLVWFSSALASSCNAQSREVFSVVNVEPGEVLNVRKAPNAKAEVVGTLSPGATEITSVGECTAWCHVQHNDVVGWVSRRFLSPTALTTKTERASSADPFADCNSDDAKRRLTGCAELIKHGTLSGVEAAIVHSRLADAKIALNALTDALTHLKKAHELQRDDNSISARLAEVHKSQAGLLAEQGNSQGALLHYSEAIHLAPTDHDARVRRSLLYAALDKLDMAIEDMEVASNATAGSGVHLRALSQLYERRGIRFHLDGEYDRAIVAFGAALALDERRDTILVHRATAHRSRGDTGEAIADLTKAIERNPDNVDAYLHRAELLFANLPDQAMLDVNRVLDRQPANAAALMMRALRLEQIGNPDAAIREYRAALQADPNQAAALDSLKRLGSSIPSAAMLKKLPAQEGAASSPASPDISLGHVFVGRWYGEVVGLNDSRLGDNRIFTVTRVDPSGLVVGRWAASPSGGQGTTVRRTKAGLRVTTNANNIIVLRAVTTNRLEGTFMHVKSGRRLSVVMTRVPQSSGGASKSETSTQPRAASLMKEDLDGRRKSRTSQSLVPGAEKREPPKGALAWGKTVLVDDGTCPSGQIKEITGGNTRHAIPRKKKCIPR